MKSNSIALLFLKAAEVEAVDLISEAEIGAWSRNGRSK